MERKNLEKLVEDLKKREVLYDYANLENFLNLEDFDKRTVYWGVDCTSESLHIGHLSNIIQLFRLSESHFKIIFITGEATTTIGDPSDKLKERPLLEKEVIKKNCHILEEQLKSISLRDTKEVLDQSNPLSCFYNSKKLREIYECLDIEYKDEKQENWENFIRKVLPKKEKNSFIFLNNKKWLSEIKFIDFVNKYGKNITVNYLLGKGKIKKRLDSESGISFSEFSYSLLQGYDFLYLYENYGCNGQIGASDQWGNFSTGLKIIKNKFENSEAFALSFSLMLDKSGKKISKTGTKSKVIWLKEEKTKLNELFDYFNNMEDNETINFAKRFTIISEEQVDKITELNKPKSLRILQRILLETFFFLIHGKRGISWIREKEIKIY